MQSAAALQQAAAQGNLLDAAVVNDLTHLMGEDKKEWMVASPSSDTASNIGSRFLQVVEDDHEEGEDDHDHAGEEEAAAAVVEEILINGTAVIGEIITEAVDAIEGENHAEEDGDHHEEGEDHMEEDLHEEGDLNEEDHHDEEDHVEEALHEEEDHHDEEEHHDDEDHAAEGSDGHDEHHDDHEDEHLESEGHDDGHDDHEDEGHDDHHDDHEDEGHGDHHDDHEDEGHDDHGHAAHAEEFNTSSSTTSNESKANGEPWGAVIGATLLVNVATFSGVLLLVLPAMYRGILKYRNVPIGSSPAANGNGRFFDIVIPGFAVGALLATAVFLVLPESVSYLSGGGHDDHAGHADELGAFEDDHAGHGHRHLQEEDSHAGEGSAAAKFGCSVLGGFLLPYIFAILFHHEDPTQEEIAKQSREGSVAVVNEEEECASCVDNTNDVESGVAVAKAVSITETGRSDAFQDDTLNTSSTPAVNKQLCASILLGDSFHNFADGFFIAAAFRSCSVAVAISIMLVTLFHEIAQELADFIVLTKFAKLPVWQALAFNFLSGLTVCLGGIVFLAANPTDTATGVILAMAGGVYINIAACETAPRIEAAMKGRGDRVLVLFSIILGTIPLGLILLDHRHCG